MAYIKALPIELQQVAEKELGEIPERIPKDLKALKMWLQQQSHLNARLDDQFLIQYLRRSKYNLEKAKKKIDLLYTFKTKFPEFGNISDVNSEKFKKFHNYRIGVPLPRPVNDNGPRIYFIKFDGDVGQGLVNLEYIFGIILAMHEIMIMEDPYVCINGIIYIMDLKDINSNFVPLYSANFLQKVQLFYKRSSPFYIKSVNFINTPEYFNCAVDIIHKVYSEKFCKKIFAYDQNYEEIYKRIPKKYFPIEYGGENGSRIEISKDYDKKWLQYAEYLKENASYGTQEHLRPGKPIDFNSLYGMGGSERKLQLD